MGAEHFSECEITLGMAAAISAIDSAEAPVHVGIWGEKRCARGSCSTNSWYSQQPHASSLLGAPVPAWML